MLPLILDALTAARAQDTNLLKTELGVFEARTGTVIVKGVGQIGSMSVGAATLAVRCKVSADATAGHKVYGLAVEIAGSDQSRERTFVDYDEIDSLLDGINYLDKITYDVTPLPSFEAYYTTRTGLRLVAYSARRQGGIQMFLQYCDQPRIPLTSDQVTQFRNLIEQAKKGKPEDGLETLPSASRRRIWSRLKQDCISLCCVLDEQFSDCLAARADLKFLIDMADMRVNRGVGKT